MPVLSEIFGDCPQLKIIEAFAENYEDKLYVADVVRITGVSKATVYKHLKKLVAEGIVEEKGKAGKIRFYQLNASNPKAKIVLMLKRFIVYERLDKLVEDGQGEEDRQSLDAAVCGAKKPQHPAQEECGKHRENNPILEDFEYIDSYGVEATSKRDGKTYIIGNFESFEDAEYFLEFEIYHFETLNERVIRHTEKTSMEAIFTECIEDFFDNKPLPEDRQI